MTATAARVPSLNPVPPLPAGPSQVPPWREIAALAQAGTFRLRCPTATPAGLLGPFWPEGDCLEPVFPEGRAMRWYDPREPAQDGDFVLVELSARFIDTLWSKNAGNPDWLAKYGRRPSSLYAVKWLRHYRDEIYLCTKNAGVPLEGNGRIMGVLRYVLIDGKPAYGSGPDHGGWDAVAPFGREVAIDLGNTSGAVDTSRIGEDAVNELVNVSVAAATVPGSPISSSPGFFSELAALAEATWENDTGETVDVRIEYSGMFATESTSTGAFYSVWGEWDIGGSDIRDGLGKFVIRSIEPEYTAKSGSFVASVPDAATLKARIAWGVSAPSGSASATDFYHDGLNLTVQAVKR